MNTLLKNQGNCHWFTDAVMVDDNNKSFTLSYAVKGDSWVFFHDYCPDMYFHTREKLYSTHNNSIYKHNAGAPGVYYSDMATKPFFLDVIFKADFDLILETVNWVTEFLQTQTDQPFKTLTHITIWNSHQHTGRVPLDKIRDNKTFQIRKTKGVWSFDDFRNVLIDKGTQFLQDIFHNYLLIDAAANTNMPWYDSEILTDKYFCVRFEFDNLVNTSLVLQDTTIQALKSDR